MQTVLGIDAGVAAVEPGEHYAWKVSIDGQSKPGWDARFSVPGGPTPPVIVGLAGPRRLRGRAAARLGRPSQRRPVPDRSAAAAVALTGRLFVEQPVALLALVALTVVVRPRVASR